jgi:hypothetical protein
MPRRTLKLRTDCWAALAWVLLLTGVIGCKGSPKHAGANADAAAMGSDAATTGSDAGPTGSDAGPSGSDAGPMSSDATDAVLTGSDAADAGRADSDAAATEVAPRPTFESYDEVLYIYMGTFTAFGELSITAEGDVYTASGKPLTGGLVGRATKE